MNAGITDYIGGFVRTLVASAAGGLVANGLVTAEQVQTIAGAAAVIAVVAWSLVQKKLFAAKVSK